MTLVQLLAYSKRLVIFAVCSSVLQWVAGGVAVGIWGARRPPTLVNHCVGEGPCHALRRPPFPRTASSCAVSSQLSGYTVKMAVETMRPLVIRVYKRDTLIIHHSH